jgi:hypothetical protein
MDPDLKSELISSLSKNFGYEKAIEIIDATEYVNFLNDEKVNTIIEFFYTSNNDLISQNTELKNTINTLISHKEKNKTSFKTVFYFVTIILSLILLIFKS